MPTRHFHRRSDGRHKITWARECIDTLKSCSGNATAARPLNLRANRRRQQEPREPPLKTKLKSSMRRKHHEFHTKHQYFLRFNYQSDPGQSAVIRETIEDRSNQDVLNKVGPKPLRVIQRPYREMFQSSPQRNKPLTHGIHSQNNSLIKDKIIGRDQTHS